MGLKWKIIWLIILYLFVVFLVSFLLQFAISFFYILGVKRVNVSTLVIIQKDFWLYFNQALEIYWWQNLLGSLAFNGFWFIFFLSKKMNIFKKSTKKTKFKEDIQNQNTGFLVDEVEKKGKRVLNINFLAGRKVPENPHNKFSKKVVKWDNGWVVKFDKKNYWVTDDKEQPHALVIGATGSGKTQRVLVPNIFYNSDPRLGHKQANFFIPVPKGEISALVGEELINRGYKIYIIDIQDTRYSQGWNPLSYIWDMFYQECEDDVQKFHNESLVDKELNNIIESLPWPPTSEKDEIWDKGAKLRLKPILKFLLFYSKIEPKFKRENFNLMNCFQFTSYDTFAKGKWVQIIKNNLNNQYMKEVWLELEPLLGDAADTQKSFLTNLSTMLGKVYNDKFIRSLLSRNEFDINKVLANKQPFCVFVKFADNEPTNFWIISLLIDQFYQKAISFADESPKGELNRRLHIYIDEFGNLPRIKNFDNKITISRSRGIRFLTAIQSYDQIQSIYTRGYKTIIENMNTTYFLSSSSQNTLKQMSETIGHKEVIKKSTSNSFNAGKKNMSESESVSNEKVMEIGQLEKLPKDQAIIKLMQKAPLRIKTKFAYQIFVNIMSQKLFKDKTYPFLEKDYFYSFSNDIAINNIDKSDKVTNGNNGGINANKLNNFSPNVTKSHRINKEAFNNHLAKVTNRQTQPMRCGFDQNHKIEQNIDSKTGERYWTCEMNSNWKGFECQWDSRQNLEQNKENPYGKEQNR